MPGLTAEDCPNKEVCGTIIQLTEEEEAELYAARMESNRRVVRTVMMSPQRAAERLLRDAKAKPSSRALDGANAPSSCVSMTLLPSEAVRSAA